MRNETVDSVVRSIAKLASYHHSDVSPDSIQVTLKPAPRTEGQVIPSDMEVADAALWLAEVKLGRGRWCEVKGNGVTPTAALAALLANYSELHRAVDERRAKAGASAKITLGLLSAE